MISISWLDGRGLKLDGVMGEVTKACTIEKVCLLYSSLLRRARGEEGGRGGGLGGGSWLHLGLRGGDRLRITGLDGENVDSNTR